MDNVNIFTGMIEHLPQPTLALDCEGTVTAWNRSIERLTGVRAADIIGKNGYEHGMALFGERRPTLTDCILNPANEPEPMYRRLRREGDFLFGESCNPLENGRMTISMAGPLYGRNGKQMGVIESLWDITEQKSLEDSLMLTNEHLMNITRSEPDMVFMIGSDGTFLQFSWGDAEKYGINPAELKGKTPHAFLPEGEAEYIITSAQEVIGTGTVITQERRFLWKGEEKAFRMSLCPIHDAGGKIVAASGISREITDTIRYEKQIRETNRMADLYLDLLGNDIYNTNMVAGTVVEMLKERLNGEEEELAQRIKNTIEQSITVIKNVELLNTLSKYRVAIEPVDLDCIIKSQIRRYSGIDINYSGCSCTVWANQLLELIIANLISNSIKYGGMRVRIDITVMEMDEIVTLTIADNGIGIPDHLKPNVFDRFSRTAKKSAGGRGLGLHIVKTLIGYYGGRVWAADRVPGKPGEGAAIKVILQKC